MPLPRVSPATPGLLGTWRQPQLEPCPAASPLSWTRLVTQRWWPASSGLSRGCRGGGCSPAWLGLGSSPEARAFPDALAGGCKRRWFLSAAGLREGTPSSRLARWLQHALW